MKKLYLMPLFFVISSFHVQAWRWSDYWDYVGQFGDNIKVWFYPSSKSDCNKLLFRGSGDFYSEYMQGSANEGSHLWDWTYIDSRGLLSMDINTSCNIIEFEEGITSTPAVAFRNWRTVKQVILPQSLLCIGYRSFMDCDSLKEVTFYGNTIGEDAFKGCDALETFIIDPKHGGVTIFNQAFSWFGPKKLIIKSNDPNLVGYHPEAFYEARHDITLCVPRVALEAYNNSSSQWKNWWRIESIEHQMTLEEYELNPNPTSGKSYGMNWSFDDGLLRVGGVRIIHKPNMEGIPINFDSITDIVIEEGVEELAYEALFQTYKNVRTLRLPETLEKLDRYCLGFFLSIEKLKILSPSLNVNAGTVRYMSTLKEMWLCAEPTVTGDGPVFDVVNFNCRVYVEGDLNFYKKTEPWSKFSNIQLMGDMGECGDIVDWKMENNTLTLEGRKDIDNYATPQDLPWYPLRNSIRAIIIGNHFSPNRNITYIGRNVIGNCPNLEKVTLSIETPPVLSPAAIQNIDLDSVILEVPFQSLEAYRNAPGWKDFKNITFATSGRCGDDATWKYKDGTLTISGTGPTYNYSFEGPYPDWYSIRHLIKKAVVEEGITSIGTCLFQYHSNMTTATISSTVTSILYCAFGDCKTLLQARLPYNLNFLGPSAFSRCPFLQDVVIPEGITTLNWGQFYNCTGLTYVGCRNPNPPTIIVRSICTKIYFHLYKNCAKTKSNKINAKGSFFTCLLLFFERRK